MRPRRLLLPHRDLLTLRRQADADRGSLCGRAFITLLSDGAMRRAATVAYAKKGFPNVRESFFVTVMTQEGVAHATA